MSEDDLYIQELLDKIEVLESDVKYFEKQVEVMKQTVKNFARDMGSLLWELEHI